VTLVSHLAISQAITIAAQALKSQDVTVAHHLKLVLPKTRAS
jgi:hypothetical protein